MFKPILGVCSWLLVACSCLAEDRAARNDWAEGTPGKANGATRDHYNRAEFL